MWPFKRKNHEADPQRNLLATIRELDRGYEVFGASSHRYKLTPVAPLELEAFEKWCGVDLPASFRTHLLEVGYGAGPYYGLWSLTQVRKELDGFYRDQENEPETQPRPSDLFPLSQSDAVNCQKRVIAGAEKPWITATWPLAGCLPIGHQGCEYYTVLQITGDSPGAVWDISECGYWLPASCAPGINKTGRSIQPKQRFPPTFEAWFQSWIDRGISDLSRW
jgi:hypothetical protein